MKERHRVQVSGLDRDRVRERAEELGVSMADYFRHLVERDLGMNPTGELNDRNDPPNLNTGDESSDSELHDIRWGVKLRNSVEELANLLCGTRREIIAKVAELGYEPLPMYRARRK